MSIIPNSRRYGFWHGISSGTFEVPQFIERFDFYTSKFYVLLDLKAAMLFWNALGPSQYNDAAVLS